MGPVRIYSVLWIVAVAAILEGCHEVATEYKVEPGRHLEKLHVLDRRANHVVYRLNNHVFEYDLRPIGNALVDENLSTRNLSAGESITSFITFKTGPSSGVRRTRFGGSIRRLEKNLSVDQLQSEAHPSGVAAQMFVPKTKPSAVEFREINGLRWLVVSKFDDKAKKIIHDQVWWTVADKFLVTMWMHVDEKAPLDAKLRNTEVKRLEALLRAFRYSE